jgi:hypothetical protein
MKQCAKSGAGRLHRERTMKTVGEDPWGGQRAELSGNSSLISSLASSPLNSGYLHTHFHSPTCRDHVHFRLVLSVLASPKHWNAQDALLCVRPLPLHDSSTWLPVIRIYFFWWLSSAKAVICFSFSQGWRYSQPLHIMSKAAMSTLAQDFLCTYIFILLGKYRNTSVDSGWAYV